MVRNLWEFIKPWVCWYRCVRHPHEDVPILLTCQRNGWRRYTIVCTRCGRKRTLLVEPFAARKRNRRH